MATASQAVATTKMLFQLPLRVKPINVRSGAGGKCFLAVQCLAALREDIAEQLGTGGIRQCWNATGERQQHDDDVYE